MKKLSNKKLLHVALCGILSGTLVSCGDSKSDLIDVLPNDRDWKGVSCDSGFKMDLLTGLNTTDAVDGILVYRGNSVAPVIVGGSPCSNASDVEGCSLLLDESSQDFLPSNLIVTSGDEVRLLEGKASVLEFLGLLDTPQKVFLWMQVNNMDMECALAESAVARSGDEQLWYGLYTETFEDGTESVTERVEITIDLDGSIEEINRVELYRSFSSISGRIPPGKLSIAEGDTCADNPELGKMFARNAAYEAASVVAFTHLKAELEHHGAPQVILDKIDVAANDELRHAKQVGDLAQKYGCEADEFTVDSGPMRDLKTIAMDNLVVGCIGETWGALLGLYQADNAQDSEVRETMTQVAIDEVGHAALSWEIQEWLYTQLGDDVKEVLASKKLEAIAKLKAKVSRSARADFELLAGLPSPAIAQALVKQIGEMVDVPYAKLAS